MKHQLNTVEDVPVGQHTCTAERIENIHERGYDDYWDWFIATEPGMPPQNPYDEGTDEHMAWDMGCWEAKNACVRASYGGLGE